MVKRRNEPCTIVQVVEILSAIMGIDEETICKAAWKNSLDFFALNKKAYKIKEN